MKYIFTLTLISTAFVVFSQKGNFPKGNFPEEYYSMKSYPKDPEAEAVILYDAAVSSFIRGVDGFEYHFEHFRRVKVFNDAGLDYGNIEIMLYQEKGMEWEKIESIEATVYNEENGRKTATKLDVSQIYDERVNQYWMRKKVAFPNVKSGSIIEYSYKVISPYVFNLRDWNFQNSVPTEYSEYITYMIPFYEYVYLLQGASKFSHQKSYIDNNLNQQFGTIIFKFYVHEFAMENIPAFKDETFISSEEDYIIKLDFQLAKVNQPNGTKRDIMTTWDKMRKDLTKDINFGKFEEKAEKQIAKSLTITETSSLSDNEKIEWAVSFVKNEYKWDGFYGKYSNKTIKELLNTKTGNDSALNLYLVALLKQMGFTAFPVIISTRGNGKIKADYPFSHFFDYTICAIKTEGGHVMLDATDILLPYYMLPQRCFNDKGLIINEEEPNWINFKSLSTSANNYTFFFQFDENLNQNITYVHLGDSYQSYQLRKKFNSNTELIRTELQKKGYSNIAEEIKIYNAEDITKPYRYSAQFQISSEILANKIYLNPFLKEGLSENPLKGDTRTYPIDFIHKISENFNVQIEIPDGYKIEYLPSDYKYGTDLFELALTTSVKDQSISLQFRYEFKNATYDVKYYNKVKSYFRDIVRVTNERIILTKE
ncbi:MAG: DUF3857 domain-containing protein [Cyclobacteriaceae bacterium]|nr:DUF3857 domain-containing protein [Cyclobacteriaceae bacterium]